MSAFLFVLDLLILGLIVGVAAILGLALFTALAYPAVRQVVQPPPGVPIVVPCRATGQPTRVRIGSIRRGREPRLAVLLCERFPGGGPRCDGPCLLAPTDTLVVGSAA